MFPEVKMIRIETRAPPTRFGLDIFFLAQREMLSSMISDTPSTCVGSVCARAPLRVRDIVVACEIPDPLLASVRDAVL